MLRIHLPIMERGIKWGEVNKQSQLGVVDYGGIIIYGGEVRGD
jgi:hypothetical protein